MFLPDWTPLRAYVPAHLKFKVRGVAWAGEQRWATGWRCMGRGPLRRWVPQGLSLALLSVQSRTGRDEANAY